MPFLDFKEIPQANLANGKQDTFELFSRDFLKNFGYEIISEPNRGRDGGKDLIVQETRIGIGGKTYIKWLVSCKHKAHSGQSVTAEDETRISDRLKAHGCNGFIGFYSTLPNSSLTDVLEGFKRSDTSFEFQIFDNGKIESELLENPIFLRIFARYFPSSFEEWTKKITIGLPTKFFKNFFEEKYLTFIEFFNAIFGSIEASIIPIQKSNNFQDLMQYVGITCVYEEFLDKWNSMTAYEIAGIDIEELLQITKNNSITEEEYLKFKGFKRMTESDREDFKNIQNKDSETMAKFIKTRGIRDFTFFEIMCVYPQEHFKSVNLVGEMPILASLSFHSPVSHKGENLYKSNEDEFDSIKNTAEYILYRKHLVYNKNAEEMFESLFQNLKDELS